MLQAEPRSRSARSRSDSSPCTCCSTSGQVRLLGKRESILELRRSRSRSIGRHLAAPPACCRIGRGPAAAAVAREAVAAGLPSGSVGAVSDNVLRVAVGSARAHGSTWRLWHSGTRDDLYVGTRSTASEMKVSLHASGDFRAAFTEQHVMSNERLAAADQRVIRQWRPREVQPGVSCALSLREPWFAGSRPVAWCKRRSDGS